MATSTTSSCMLLVRSARPAANLQGGALTSARRSFSSAIVARQEGAARQARPDKHSPGAAGAGRPHTKKERPPRTVERQRPEHVIKSASASTSPAKQGSSSDLPFVLPKTDWWNPVYSLNAPRPTLQPAEDTPCETVPYRSARPDGAAPRYRTLRDANQSLQVRVNYPAQASKAAAGPQRGHGTSKPLAYNGPLTSERERQEMEVKEVVGGDASQYQPLASLKSNDSQIVKGAAQALSAENTMRLELKFWTVDKIRELQDGRAIQAANDKMAGQRQTDKAEGTSEAAPDAAKAKAKGKGGRK